MQSQLEANIAEHWHLGTNKLNTRMSKYSPKIVSSCYFPIVAEQLVDRSQRAACTIDYVTQRRAFVAQSNEQFPGSFDEGSPAAVKSVTFGLIGHFSANLDENGLPDNSVISITSSHMHKS